ncbi:DeoR family transcriptional regulator [Streptomyces sp. 3MP-14]|uniref:DeoR family transcriptional regulator n=1 Tax=Streptomyces mimosae TaxID=2586635 RepID=A0A5N6A6E7_9ACTN|nr:MULTISPECIES: substrate-binding domain-containing protein [Streptomyces]KAB8164241.1 DeoR family transcriptional regulator [Streptomyces mimosae]KAB8176518.1 DeoR family transcriptional regulator [Streptomyces sp. 3MP-14]
MLVEQRQELLLRELHASGAVRVAELAARFGVSAGTIRRDLAELAELGRLTKVRGGAILAGPRGEPSLLTGEPAPPVEPSAAAPSPEPPPAPSAPAAERTIGLLVPSATYYYPSVVAGVRSVAARRNTRIVIGLTQYDSPRDIQQIDELCATGAGGLLIASTGGHYLPAPTLERLRATGLPFVLLERRPEDPYEPCEFVVSDHRLGAFNALRQLHGLGHRSVGLYLNETPTAPLIREGYQHAVARLGLDPGAPAIDGGRPAPDARGADRRYDAFIDALLANGTRAALVHSDYDAIELLQRLRARGLHTPGEMALIAYDDEIASLAEVPLTAVAPAKRLLGEVAAQLLLDRMDTPPDAGPLATRHVVLHPRLTIRDSCGSRPPAQPTGQPSGGADA